MKKLTSQKWILSGFLIGALASQYYYSVSSTQLLSADFASTVAADPVAVQAELKALQTARPSTVAVSVPPLQTATQPPPTSPPVVASTTVVTPTLQSTVAPTTQAVGTATECADCRVITGQQFARIEQMLTNYRALLTESVSQTTIADTPEARCANERTATARERCIRQEREEENRDARNLEFEDKMASYADRHGDDLNRLSSRLRSLLRSYSGSRKIDPAVALRAYQQYIQPLLRSKLASMNEDSSSDDLETVISDINSISPDYSNVKNALALELKRSAEARAASIRATLVEAREAYNNQDAIQANELFQQASVDRNRLVADFKGNPRTGQQGYLNMVTAGLSSDTTALTFAQTNLIPAVRNLFTDLDRAGNNFLNINPQTGNVEGSNGGRGSRAGAPTPAPSSSPTVNTSNVNDAGSQIPTNNNMLIGSPQPSLNGGRGARR